MRPIEQLIKCAAKTLAIHRNSSAKWVKAGKLTEAKAAEELGCMEDIVALLQRQQILEEISDEMLGRKSVPVEVQRAPKAQVAKELPVTKSVLAERFRAIRQGL